MFEEIFKHSYFRGRKSFKNSDINLISEECLQTYHPGLLYRLALKNNPQGNNEEIFKMMKQLHTLETSQEKIRLQTEEQALSLIERFNTSKTKKLILKK